MRPKKFAKLTDKNFREGSVGSMSGWETDYGEGKGERGREKDLLKESIW